MKKRSQHDTREGFRLSYDAVLVHINDSINLHLPIGLVREQTDVNMG